MGKPEAIPLIDLPLNTIFAEGGELTESSDTVRIVFWKLHAAAPGGIVREPVTEVAMTIGAWRRFVAQMFGVPSRVH